MGLRCHARETPGQVRIKPGTEDRGWRGADRCAGHRWEQKTPSKQLPPGLETGTEQNGGLKWRGSVLRVHGCHRPQSQVTLGRGDRKTSL